MFRKSVEEEAELNKEVAGHIYSWHIAFNIAPKSKAHRESSAQINRSAAKAMENGRQCFIMAKELVQGSANKLKRPIDILYDRTHVCTTIAPTEEVPTSSRQSRKRRA